MMWRLLAQPLFVRLLADDEDPPPPLLSDAQKEEILVKAERELGDLQQLLGVMYKKGFRDNPEYQELVNMYGNLSRGIMEAVKYVTLPESRSKAGDRPVAQAAPKRLKESIKVAMPRFSSVLGPANQRGKVSSGMEVENLQKVLNWERQSVSIDGNYSPETMLAVKHLQKKYGIQPSGVVGSETRRLLNVLIGHE